MVQVVNVVGSGKLPVEIDVKALATDIGPPEAEYDPAKYHGMYLRLDQEGPLITLYRSGKYIVTGADSTEEAIQYRDKLFNRLTQFGIIETGQGNDFSIQNIVCTDELDTSLNLSALSIGLGLEVTEYEPEQFPGLIYRPTHSPCVMLLFASGKVLIMGIETVDEAQQCVDQLKRKLSEKSLV